MSPKKVDEVEIDECIALSGRKDERAPGKQLETPGNTKLAIHLFVCSRKKGKRIKKEQRSRYHGSKFRVSDYRFSFQLNFVCS